MGITGKNHHYTKELNTVFFQVRFQIKYCYFNSNILSMNFIFHIFKICTISTNLKDLLPL